MPTAAVAHASLARPSPGSAIWKSAISDLRRPALDLVEVARVVAQPREQLAGLLELGVAGALLAQEARDLVHGLVPLAADAFRQPRDGLGSSLALRLQQLLAILERLLEKFLRHDRCSAALLAGDLHSAQREQLLRTANRSTTPSGWGGGCTLPQEGHSASVGARAAPQLQQAFGLSGMRSSSV